MNQKTAMSKKGQVFGFTLTELLMVVVILGILAAVAIPRFAPQKEKAYVADAVGILSAIRQSQEAYRLDVGTYRDIPATAINGANDGDWLAIGITNPNQAAATAYWTYAVTGGNSATAFTVVATRTNRRSNVGNGTDFNGRLITIDQAGSYTGGTPSTHEFTPNP